MQLRCNLSCRCSLSSGAGVCATGLRRPFCVITFGGEQQVHVSVDELGNVAAVKGAAESDIEDLIVDDLGGGRSRVRRVRRPKNYPFP